MRGINENFVEDLKNGELAYFLEQVKSESNKLCLAIRKNYINIYFRGGNLLKISQKRDGYSFDFDARYCLNKGDDSKHALLSGSSSADRENYEKNFHLMMAEMDAWFDKHPKPEREFQHQLFLQNPEVVDIEYQIGGKIRLDMLCLFEGQLYIVENKYGESSIGGEAGLAKHYEDICRILDDTHLLNSIRKSVDNISRIKRDLGLPAPGLNLDFNKFPKILFLFADYNKKS